jgi:hypothetical protein
MEILAETEHYTLYWHDTEKTIIRLDIERGWTWDDAHIALGMMDEIIPSVNHDVYTVYSFKPGASALPRNFAMSNIKTLLNSEVPNEKMFIFVGSQTLITSFIAMVTKVYGNLTRNASKLQIMSTNEEALTHIEENKRKIAEEA